MELAIGKLLKYKLAERTIAIARDGRSDAESLYPLIVDDIYCKEEYAALCSALRITYESVGLTAKRFKAQPAV